MKNINLIISSVLTLGLALTSCSKDEGKGGDSKIVGNVYVVSDDGSIAYSDNLGYYFKRDTTKALGESVYITYGGGIGAYDDKTSTNGEGYFEFDYLRGGDYTVYAIADGENGDVPVYRNINIGDNGTHRVESIYLNDGKNTGKCGYVGSLMAMYSKADDYQPGYDQRVYIQKADGTDKSDTRVGVNGVFEFSKLDSNSWYMVYAYSEPVKNAGLQMVAASFCTGESGSIINATAEPLLIVVY